jgi:hypothetical protein
MSHIEFMKFCQNHWSLMFPQQRGSTKWGTEQVVFVLPVLKLRHISYKDSQSTFERVSFFVRFSAQQRHI